LYIIANELAEANRLKRLELEMKFRTQANRALYKVVEHNGKKLTIPPSDKDKEEWKLENEAITKELADQAL